MVEERTKKETPRPTDAELAILRVLWDRGPSTVRDVHDVSGRLVRRLATDARLDGDVDFEWDGRTDGGVPARPGVYFVRLMLEGRTTTIPVVRLP